MATVVNRLELEKNPLPTHAANNTDFAGVCAGLEDVKAKPYGSESRGEDRTAFDSRLRGRGTLVIEKVVYSVRHVMRRMRRCPVLHTNLAVQSLR